MAYAPPPGFAVAANLRRAYTPPPGFAVAANFVAADLVANPDAYAAQKGATLVVAAPGVLGNDSDPGGLALTAHLSAGPAHGTLSLASDGGFSYTPSPDFVGVDSWTYYARNSGGAESDDATVSITVSTPPVQRYDRIEARMPWSPRTPTRARAIASGWSMPVPVARAVAAPFAHAEPVQAETRARWLRSRRVAREATVPWQSAPVRAQTATVLPWASPPRVRAEARAPWALPPNLQRSAAVPWRAPPRLRVEAALPWTVPPALRRLARIPWRHPTLHNRAWWVPWTHAPAIAWHIPSPGVQPGPPQAPPPHYIPPAGFAVPGNFACPWSRPPGFAVPGRIGPAACYFARPRPRRYIVLNSAAVVRLPDRTAIAVDSIDISESVGDAHASISLGLAKPSDLAMLIDTDSPREVEINLNGHVYTGIIESWDTSTEFPGKTVTVAGRSRSALLDAPYAPPRAYVETAERLAAQLVDRELTDTGWTADYDTIDWLIPAGAWHYDALTPIAAIRTVAAASGAIARAHPYSDVIEILPRYPVSPWYWSVTAADRTIDDDFVPRVVARIGRSGSSTYELDLPLWPPTAGDKPGLVRPLQLVEFAAASGWKALVTQTRLSARMERAGNGANVLTVWQSLTLEAPPAEPRFDYVLVSGEQVGVSDPIKRDGTAGTKRLPQITDPLITTHPVALERGRNAIASGGDGNAPSNLWQALVGLIPQSRPVKGNVTAANADGSYTILTADGSTIRARPLPGQTWEATAGVFVLDGRIIDSAPNLPSTEQTV